ncbi:MAG TPA: peptidase M14, partial [Candidatus Marinimicrobia bacterium]|nr:peptidase M14 [Candidatus Neomarinimicrobiota bacterium]
MMNRKWTVYLLSAVFLLSVGHSQKPPSPQDVFGFRIGDDYKLADHSQMVDYYKKLADASDRVQLTEIGKSALGRPMLLLFISTPENLKQLDNWKSISTKLARARVSEDEAKKLVKEGKSILWIDGGMHATERAHGQMTAELAYRVATEESDEMKKIRENVILLLMPVINP